MDAGDSEEPKSILKNVPITEEERRPSQVDWSRVPFWKSQRFLTALVMFVGFANLYMNRVNLSIAMVCMVRTPYHNYTASSSGRADGFPGSDGVTRPADVSFGYSQPPSLNTTSGLVAGALEVETELQPGDDGYCDYLGRKSKHADKEGEFPWSKELQGLILGSFFWGYLVLQIPGGVLSEKYGPTRVIFFTMLPVGLLGIISPVCARVSPWFFLVIRVLIGVGEGALYSSTHALWGRWSPPEERTKLVGISFSGGQFGNALIFPIGGYMCSNWGWDSIFYLMGTFCTVWCFVFYFLVYDSPSRSRRITKLERGYIQSHVTFRDNAIKPPIPWRQILTCVPFWAIMVAHTCGNYGLYMLLTQIPTYMKEVLKFDLKSNGVFSMLPYLTMWFFISVASVITDYIIARDFMSRTAARKLMSCIGLFLPALCSALISFLDCTQPWLAVALLCGTVGLSGVAFSGYMVNHGDIAPLFAGTMFGVTNLAATVPGIIAPYVVGALTPNQTREEWQVTFFIAAGVYCFGGIFYLIFANGEEEPWARSKRKASTPDTIAMMDIHRHKSIAIY